ncbi:ImmA/IrrE family metallo-endopeptidase [Roseovarius rhodophyticola]|uniref:ImmA/IrrE family metallo-endopeptidase n=1 Tax=Roseovarius rhodophyticola TaxID=3080827 RepID=A0ABZ2TIP1_9RHOB|nr:ImmA/IrrE family metallo-endopeptidase [Roseovarius sp. W115]MDV2929747.1 ImmA/IrrE family metallo-endopeptidase [Roseovarius sp. W115]
MNISDQWDVLTAARKSAPVGVHVLPEKLGIGLQAAFLTQGISGMLERIGDSFLITVSAKDPYTRQRFTLAHELGHYMLHRHLVGDGIDDDRAYRSTESGKYHNTMIGPSEETEANKFAANLLMPRELVNLEKKKPGTTVASMAQLFGVSEHAMSIRLGLSYPEGSLPSVDH